MEWKQPLDGIKQTRKRYEFLFLFCHFFEGVLESLDAGSVYSGRDWTMRGNIIRKNYFANIPRSAIYYDDQFSSAEAYQNTFFNVYMGMILC